MYDTTLVSVPYWGSLSSNDDKAEATACNLLVSVPYWGSLSSNFNEFLSSEKSDNMFPSPTGVLYLLITY